MTKIILVRHGQTQWNVEQRFRGSHDIPLDEMGIRQAEALADRLALEPIAAAYSGPLQRAMKTAEIIGRPHQCVPLPLEGLSNINYGELEGRKISEVAEQFPEFYRTMIETPQLVRFPGGDTLDELMDRAMAGLHTIITQHPEQTVLAVTHQVIARVLICGILGLDNSHHWDISQDTCCMNEFRFKKGRFVLDRLNDVCHLSQLEKEEN